jgi:Raf kinase inhibitor-like YbhB/YbcL family protein
MDIKITSSAFAEGGMIPKKYTSDGDNVSPPLSWESIPSGAQSIALITDDPDAPMGTWVHWVLYNLPADVRSLAENVPAQEKLEYGALQGINDFRKIGYGGPSPPSGVHRYFFKIYALDILLEAVPDMTKSMLLSAMEGHKLGEGLLIGRYERQ